MEMNQAQITIAIFNEMFNESLREILIKGKFSVQDETEIIGSQEIFPPIIENPSISDIYADQNNESQEQTIVLGSYTPMKSPAVITSHLGFNVMGLFSIFIFNNQR